ncbi:MAG: hypothetical protein ACP5KS_15275 [Candidatus Hydrogenedens sp.]
MIDRIELDPWEKSIIDTSSNSVSILVCSGKLVITNENEDKVISELKQWEVFTLPIQTGKYVLRAQDDWVLAYLFRMFIY